MKICLQYPGFKERQHEGPHSLGREYAGADSLYRYNLIHFMRKCSIQSLSLCINAQPVNNYKVLHNILYIDLANDIV